MVPARLERDFVAVLRILSQSERHRNYTIGGIERLIVPPLELGQYYLDVNHGVYISWAFLSDKAQRGFVDGSRKIWPTDWNDGPYMWMIDLATTGRAGKVLLPMLRHVKSQYPDIRKVNFRRWYPDRSRRYNEVGFSNVLEPV